MASTFTPVPYVFREIIDEELQKGTRGKIFYFTPDQEVGSFEGIILSMREIPKEGIFIFLEPEYNIRIDRIITLFGKPGAAYEAYDAYSNQCFSCTGGYPKD